MARVGLPLAIPCERAVTGICMESPRRIWRGSGRVLEFTISVRLTSRAASLPLRKSMSEFTNRPMLESRGAMTISSLTVRVVVMAAAVSASRAASISRIFLISSKRERGVGPSDSRLMRKSGATGWATPTPWRSVWSWLKRVFTSV